jgi:pSer/pThr/pTyr-binding forkhead associated (FHA) protein
MGASAAEIPTSPDEQPVPGLRASDAERDEVAARLKDEFVAGRLSHDTFLHRINAVLEARQQADLPPLIADLPATGAPSLVDRFRGAWWRMTGQGGLRGLTGLTGLRRPPGSGGAGHPAGAGAGVGAGPRERWTGPRPAIPARTVNAGAGLIRGTMGLSSTGDPNSDPNSPLSLQFPRGADKEFSIGRDASCDLAIADMTVSRRHATLERTSDGWLLSDLESTNGTRVNGWRVRGKVVVRPGDLICFGNLVAIFARDDRDNTVPPGTMSPESARAPDRP